MMLDFIHFFAEKQYHGKNPFSLRDILSWVDFMRSTFGKLGPAGSYLHGAQMILLDGLGITHPLIAKTLQRECMQRLNQQVAAFDIPVAITQLLASAGQASELPEWINDDTSFGIGSFSVPKVQGAITSGRRNQYTFDAPTTATNLIRLLRSLQLKKPVLLEGSPGVGKTTLVEALGQVLGRRVVRINLSEQTDMLDLLGADLPQEDGPLSSEPTFTWRDGVFLDALKAGDWVLLDEMNLANQSVLEGLNAVLDHRATVYIPELNQSFICPPTFRIFACQNPTTQGGGRKGLPKSFLNRFTKVYLDKFETSDLLFVANSLYGDVSPDLIDKMVTFNQTLFRETMEEGLYGRLGSPWEFNLRDILRWCSLVRKTTLHRTWWFLLIYYYYNYFKTPSAFSTVR
jgi:midasin